jgi:hypothetical protein
VRRSSKGAQYFGGQFADSSSPRPSPAAEPAAPRAEPPRAAEPPRPPEPAPTLADDSGTALPVAADAPPDELARVLMTSPSPAQRLAIIARLRGVKHPAVVAALRANAMSQHPGVRAAAEAAMAALFGPNWSTSRPIPKPVQPPPTDDKDRGPPGGW